jgi:hypothetical protein
LIAWVATAAAATWDLVKDHRSDRTFVTPSPEERVSWSEVVADLLRAAPGGQTPDTLRDRAAALGFEWLDRGDGTIVLADRADALRGAGVFAVRLGPLATELVLQAPHPFYDKGTGQLAAELFDAGAVRALCVATANRYAAEGSDPAHAPEGWMQAATDGIARAVPAPLFVQIHGFSQKTTDACAVLSDGPVRLDPARLQSAGRAVADALGCEDVRTGDQVPELAARKNAQGLLLVDRAAFLHLELSPEIRTSLLADEGRQVHLSAALSKLAGGD